MDPGRARQLLEAERERLRTLRDEHVAGSLEQSQQQASGELTTFDQHPADVATDTHERERDESLLQHLDWQIEEVEAAFRRLDAGTYGICEGTGEPIPDERLEALPAVRYTVGYQRRLEHQQGTAGGRSDRAPPPG